MNADLVIINGKVITVDHDFSIKQAIAVKDGKIVADFCIIGENILTVDPHKIGEIPVLMTIVGGQIVFDESDGDFI